VRKVVRGMNSNAHSLCDVLSLNGLTGLLSQAQLLISNDTGPLHLARAVGTPTVGIYWCGNIVTAGMITAKKNRMSISWKMHCPLCGVNCMKVDVHHPPSGCDHKASFLDDISVHEVTEHALSLLD
jgi:ADP-heptose:LPS heptosyltransferase